MQILYKSRHEQVYLMRFCFKRYFSHHQLHQMHYALGIRCTAHKIHSTSDTLIRAHSSSLLRVIITCDHLPFFKIFLNFVHFCPDFQIFCPFSEKKYFQILYIFAQIFKYFAHFQHLFALFLKNCTHPLTF